MSLSKTYCNKVQKRGVGVRQKKDSYSLKLLSPFFPPIYSHVCLTVGHCIVTRDLERELGTYPFLFIKAHAYTMHIVPQEGEVKCSSATTAFSVGKSGRSRCILEKPHVRNSTS